MTAISAAHGSAWMRMAFATVAVLSGSCAPPTVLPHPEGPRHYMIPLEAQNSDYVCAETLPQVPTNFCVTVRAFRVMVIDPKVEP